MSCYAIYQASYEVSLPLSANTDFVKLIVALNEVMSTSFSSGICTLNFFSISARISRAKGNLSLDL